MRNHFIYALVDENLIPFYVGQTNNMLRRFETHIYESTRTGFKVHKKIRKLIRNKQYFSMSMIEVCEKEKLDDKEIFWIAKFKSLGYKLCNLTDGGKYFNGMDKKCLEKLHKGRLGQKRSEETKAKMSKAQKGKKRSEETKAKLREAWKTRPAHTQETLEKMRKSSTGKINIKKYRLLGPDGKEYITENGLVQFCIPRNLQSSNLHKIFAGRRSGTHKGWRILECLNTTI